MLTGITIFSIIVAIVIFFQVKLRWSNKNYGKEFETFLKDEIDANDTRKKGIDDNIFIKIDLEKLPIKKYTESDSSLLKHLQEKVLKQSNKKMILFEQYKDNTQIKIDYGVNNLESIIEYEENLQVFIKQLNEWASSLIKAEDYSSAENVLIYCIELNSKYFTTYNLIIDIYKKQNEKIKIKNLIENLIKIDFSNDKITKSKIIDYANDVINNSI